MVSEVLVRNRRGAVAVAFLLSLLLLFSGIGTDHARAAAAKKPQKELLALTNEARSEHGRSALALNAKLSRYATKHSRAMADKGFLFHTADLVAKLKGLDWSMGGENIGVASSLDDVQAAFMASKDHRKNILQKVYDHAAIGIVESDGVIWVTVIFYG
jgi:uncharacterized protein YkwD